MVEHGANAFGDPRGVRQRFRRQCRQRREHLANRFVVVVVDRRAAVERGEERGVTGKRGDRLAGLECLPS